jgi:UbiD family decarboxylase
MKDNYLGPYKSFRDYLSALEHFNYIEHVDMIDQDAYEATALVYKIMDNRKVYEAPALFFDQIQSKGKQFKHSLVGNLYGKWDFESIALGIMPVKGSPQQSYKNALEKLDNHISHNDKWEAIEPIEIKASKAPCKEIKILGDDINLHNFPFIQTNPADGGCYINMGNVILKDKDLGRNIGTYRCQIKNSKKISLNPQVNQDGWRFLMNMKERGEKTADVAIVLGTDPITFSLSGSKVAQYGEDELGIAGGIIGEAIEVVKCENNDILVPANVEMVIEGTIPLDKMEEEGPFGEMYGYIGEKKEENFYMDVLAITHREKPIFSNQFTGITRGCLTAPIEAALNRKYKKQFESFMGLHYPLEIPGFCFVNLESSSFDESMSIGTEISKSLKIAKITVLLDSEVDIHNLHEVLHAIGSRWQPFSSSEIIEKANALSGDPSSTERGKGSRIVINAMKNSIQIQTNLEFAKTNRECLEAEFPDVFDQINTKFKDLI